MGVRKTFLPALALALLLGLFSACGVPPLDPSTPLGRNGIADSVNMSLLSGDCNAAYVTILPYYNSAYSDDRARFLMASTFGCYAGVNTLRILNDLTAGGFTDFWDFISLEFPPPSSGQNKNVAYTQGGTDALMAIVYNPTLILPADLINGATHNPGSIVQTDRTADANSFLFFMSMGQVGSIQQVNGADPVTGAPSPAFAINGDTVATLDANGCAYASAAINMIDGLSALIGQLSGGTAAQLSALLTAIQTPIFAACDAGCFNQVLPPPFVRSNCSVPTHCTSCPDTLRNRNACVIGSTSDPNTCAAAGVVDFLHHAGVNAGWQ